MPSGDESAWVQYLREDIGLLRSALAEYRQEASRRYVTRDEFQPVKQVVYGIVGLIVAGVFGAILRLIIVAN